MKPLERLTHLGLAVLAATVISVPSATPAAAENNGTAIRPFRVKVPGADLTDLRRRIQATRWPDKETVADRSQGPQRAQLQELVRYWGNGYNWRKAEAKLKDLLPPRRQGRPLRGVGIPRAVCRRTPCRLPITPRRADHSTVIAFRSISRRLLAKIPQLSRNTPAARYSAVAANAVGA